MRHSPRLLWPSPSPESGDDIVFKQTRPREGCQPSNLPNQLSVFYVGVTVQWLVTLLGAPPLGMRLSSWLGSPLHGSGSSLLASFGPEPHWASGTSRRGVLPAVHLVYPWACHLAASLPGAYARSGPCPWLWSGGGEGDTEMRRGVLMSRPLLLRNPCPVVYSLAVLQILLSPCLFHNFLVSPCSRKMFPPEKTWKQLKKAIKENQFLVRQLGNRGWGSAV